MAVHYVNNDALVTELKRAKAAQRPTTELAEMFQMIASRVSNKFVYDDKCDKEDCVAAAVEIMLKKYDKFDFELRTNAFS